jgi:hypothetical protein
MIGGPGSFPGYELGEIRADDYWSASGSYLRKVKDIMSIRGQALYAGLRLEGGETFDLIRPADDGRLLRGVGLSDRPHAGRPADRGHRRHQQRFLDLMARRRAARSATARSWSAASSVEAGLKCGTRRPTSHPCQIRSPPIDQKPAR